MASHPIAFRLIKGSDSREDGSTLNGVVSFFLHKGVGLSCRVPIERAQSGRAHFESMDQHRKSVEMLFLCG